MEEKTVRSRRLLTMTEDQDILLKREARRRNAPEYVVLREVLDAGFKAKFGDGGGANDDALFDAVERLSDDMERLRLESRSQGLASLGWASWASFAAFDMLRCALGELGVDPDGESLASSAMSGFMASTDCSVPTRIWESTGRRMARGEGYHDALLIACRENGVTWEEFSGGGGQQPESERDADQKGASNGKRKKRHGR